MNTLLFLAFCLLIVTFDEVKCGVLKFGSKNANKNINQIKLRLQNVTTTQATTTTTTKPAPFVKCEIATVRSFIF